MAWTSPLQPPRHSPLQPLRRTNAERAKAEQVTAEWEEAEWEALVVQCCQLLWVIPACRRQHSCYSPPLRS